MSRGFESFIKIWWLAVAGGKYFWRIEIFLMIWNLVVETESCSVLLCLTFSFIFSSEILQLDQFCSLTVHSDPRWNVSKDRIFWKWNILLTLASLTHSGLLWTKSLSIFSSSRLSWISRYRIIGCTGPWLQCSVVMALQNMLGKPSKETISYVMVLKMLKSDSN